MILRSAALALLLAVQVIVITRPPILIPAPSEGGGGSELAFDYYCQGGYTGAGTVRTSNGADEDGTANDTQSMIDASSDGDIVCVPAGSYEWNTGVAITDTELLLIGAGIGNTVITLDADIGASAAVHVNMLGADTGDFRISGFTFQGANHSGTTIKLDSGGYTGIPTGRWRIDHNHFNYPTNQRVGLQISGVHYGLFDHNQMDWFSGVAIKFSQGLNQPNECPIGTELPPVGAFLLEQPADWSTDKFVFIEDNTLIGYGTGNSAFVDVDQGGGRMVFRENAVSGGYLYSHWPEGCDLTYLFYQIYNNTFQGDEHWGAPQGSKYVARMESGAGVVYNNAAFDYRDGGGGPYLHLNDRRAAQTEIGTLGNCDGMQTWDGNVEANGWPCLGQIGRGPGKTWTQITAGELLPSIPVTLWNNGEESGCANGGSCTDTWGVFGDPSAYVKATAHSNGQVDYAVDNTPLAGYSAPTYPHAKVGVVWP